MLAGIGHTIGDRLGRDNAVVAALQPIYARCLAALCGNRGLAWHVNGEPMRIDPAVRRMLPHVNEPELFQYLSNGIKPGQFVVDIGAFLGTYAILAARRVGSSGRVLAFEPSPTSFAILVRHLAMNDLAPPLVDARCAAVGARSEERLLQTCDDEPYRNMIAPDGGTGVPVPMVTLDEVCASCSQPPDWIRMDVQGQEFDVLRGARELLRASGGRTRIVAEMHPEQWPDFGVSVADAHDVFAELGLRARPLVPDAETFVQSGHVTLEAL